MSETEQSSSKVFQKFNIIAGASVAVILLLGSSYLIGNNNSHK
jgi:hypothetical protein